MAPINGAQQWHPTALNNGTQWHPMTSNNGAQQGHPMALNNGTQWHPMAPNGTQRHPTASNSTQRHPTAPNGIQQRCSTTAPNDTQWYPTTAPNNSTQQHPTAPYLGVELEWTLAGTAGVDGELGRAIDDAAGGLQPRPEGLHLRVGMVRPGQAQRVAMGGGGVAMGGGGVAVGTLSGQEAPGAGAGRTWAMKGLWWMSSSSQTTWTA